jgi:hypothetical protein
MVFLGGLFYKSMWSNLNKLRIIKQEVLYAMSLGGIIYNNLLYYIYK